MNITFLKKNCGAEIEGKKKYGKLIYGNDIPKIKGKKMTNRSQ